VNEQGAFAEYLRLPAFNVVPLPDSIDDEIGAILDPLGNAVHTALSFDLVGEDVLITGAGPSASWPPPSPAMPARATS
jgi:threonine 3-dehydrogenase